MNEFAEVFKKVDVLLSSDPAQCGSKSGIAENDPIFGLHCRPFGGQLQFGRYSGYYPFPAVLPARSSPLFSKEGVRGSSDFVDTPSMDGLPVGLQIIGPQWGEQKIFNVGYAYQQATDWHRKHPGDRVASGSDQADVLLPISINTNHYFMKLKL